MASTLKGATRLLVQAGSAKPSPKIGQALGPLGVNMMEFCKQFNARTEHMKETAILRVKLDAFEDRSFNFDILPPPTTWYLKRVTGISKGTSTPGHATVGDISIRAIYEIAVSKQQNDPNMKTLPLKSIVKSVVASAKSFGLRVTA